MTCVEALFIPPVAAADDDATRDDSNSRIGSPRSPPYRERLRSIRFALPYRRLALRYSEWRAHVPAAGDMKPPCRWSHSVTDYPTVSVRCSGLEFQETVRLADSWRAACAFFSSFPDAAFADTLSP